LSFMPSALASGSKKIFWWQANVTPPKSYEKWDGLIHDLVAHWIERYGADEVRHWNFEIWNEPNGDWFWKPKANADDYAKLALTVAKEIKKAVPEADVVGPAASGAGTAFIEVSAKAGVFPYWSGITVHPYERSKPENYIKAYDATRRYFPDASVEAVYINFPDPWPKTRGSTRKLMGNISPASSSSMSYQASR